MTQIVHRRTSDNTVLAFNEYEYDAAGNRTSMTDASGAHSFGYDDLHRLISAAHPAAGGLADEAFTLDAVGNRLADARITGYTYDAANRLLENSSYTYTYDADGNRLTKQDKLTGHTTTYAFNSENQLVGVTRPNGESWTYKYDRPGRRVEKSSGTQASQVTRFVHDGDNILAILDGDNNPRQVFTNGLNIDEPISMRSATGVERYFHADALGSVRALTSAGTDIVETYDYESYGKPVVKDTGGATIMVAQSENRLLYTARHYDEESGWFELRRRQYDPITGLFVSEDPIGLKGGLNQFVYVQNNPTNFTDPSGLYGTNDCSYYKRRCDESGGYYYCTVAPFACETFLKFPDPDPENALDFEGWHRCTRKCLQDCDYAQKSISKCEKIDPDTDSFFDLKPTMCHASCYSSCGISKIQSLISK